MKDSDPANVSLLHHVPGRIRLRVLSAKGNASAAASISQSVLRSPGIRKVRVCELTGSVVVEYDWAHTDSRALMKLFRIPAVRMPAVRLPELKTSHAAPRQRECRVPAKCTCGAASQPAGRPLVDQIGSWLLGKTVEIALEKSLMLLLAAVL